MTCHDARELFSALLDETLTRNERADVYGHLATCADCRRELEAVERTVALIRGATPVRAPAGFVDRVVAAARPKPWYARAARAALLPWPVKVPLSAAAILLVGGLAALIFRGVQEPRRSAEYPPTPPATPSTDAAAPERAEARRADERAAARDAAPVETFTGARAPVPGENRETSAAAKLEMPRAMSMPAPAADVVARLRAPERDTAERALAALAARLAGAQTGRRLDGDALVVELAVPRDRYGDFTREAARFGDYRTESEPPALPDTVRIVVRLGS